MGQLAISKTNLVSEGKTEESKNDGWTDSISHFKGHDELNHRYLSIVIPAYNEEKRIAGTLIETSAAMDSFSIPHEIIVVNDGSSDRTFEEASKVAGKLNNVKVVHYTQNGGKGNAIKYGCKFVTGDLVTFLDADLELHPVLLKGFFEKMDTNNADIVVGSKRHPLSKVNYPHHRKILSWLYHILIKGMFNLPVNDTQLGLKLFKREVIDSIMPKILVKRYAYDVEILVNAKHMGFKTVEAPIELNFKRKMGRIKFKDIIKISQDTAAIFYRMYILKYYDEKPVSTKPQIDIRRNPFTTPQAKKS